MNDFHYDLDTFKSLIEFGGINHRNYKVKKIIIDGKLSDYKLSGWYERNNSMIQEISIDELDLIKNESTVILECKRLN